MKTMLTYFMAIILLVSSTAVQAGQVLDKYVETGLSANLALERQQFSLKQSLQALKEARGMFFPSISIEARYSRAGGGRMIDVPIGDMVNPIHRTLNQLLMAHGYPPGYPANIPNESIPFLREHEHDTKLRIIQPLFQPAIFFNLKIKKKLSAVEQAKLAAFKRQLTEDIKKAYFNYLKTLEIDKLLKNTRELLEENLRVSQSLFENHKATEEVVYRSRAELSRLERQQAEAEKNCKLAASYFNFLLNRPLETGIEIEPLNEKPAFKTYAVEKLIARALEQREEFLQVQTAIEAAHHEASLHAASKLPTLSAVLDYGFQGENYRFSGEDDYWMGSLAMSWNLSRGGQDAAKQKQALFRQKQLETQRHELENQIRLQVTEAFYNLEVAKKAIASTGDTLESREQAFFIISKKYRQGMVPQIEYIEARSAATNAGINNIIAIYDYYIEEARLERASAAIPFK